MFNNLGHPIYSTWLNWGRHTIGTWPPIVMLSSFGASGVLIGQALGGVIFAAIAFMLVRRVNAQLDTTAPDAQGFGIHQRIHMLFARGRW